MTTAIYAGSFDPPTNGHIDIARRAARQFSKIIVAVGVNSSKSSMFSGEERTAMLRELLADLPNVEITSFEGLLVEFAKSRGATSLLRGLRAVSDFENEFQMALTNRSLAPDIETVFLMTTPEHMFVSSSIVREVAMYGGDVSGLVPAIVAEHLKDKKRNQ